jgi:hypothetical protein
MSVDVGLFSDAVQVVQLAGAAVLGVLLAVKCIDWIRMVLIEREASREYYDRYGG